MNALKALVIGMGILIVAGVAVIAVAIVRGKTADAPMAQEKPAIGLAQSAVPSEAQSGDKSSEAKSNAALPSFGVRDIAVPAGSEIVSITAADGRIILELQDAEQVTRILLLDPVNGAALGGWRLVESATSRGMTP
jgi:hypothetical protein